MNKNLLRSIIRDVAGQRLKPTQYNKYANIELLQTHSQLIPILTDLMTPDFHYFIEDIQWIAPTPKTYKVVLKNNQFFYLQDLERSWVAEVAGKRHYLLSLGEETMASNGIARLLKITAASMPADENMDADLTDVTATGSSGGGAEATPAEPEIPTGEELPDELTPA